MNSPMSAHPDELSAWLRLTLEPNLPPAQARLLLAALGLPQHVFEASVATLAKYLPMPLAVQLHQPPSEEIAARIQATLRWLGLDASGDAETGANHHLLTLADPHYPPALLALHDPPLVLYVNGNLDSLNRPSFAIVGARNATPGGQDNARAFARHLAGQGWSIVSGLAHGIDAAAHEGALLSGDTGGGTVAVMATGIDIVYPAANLKLAHRIAASGALVSEYPLGTPSLPHQFPQRNRIVAGLTRGVLVVEAAKQSGSLITARLAAELGREVFAIPGSIHSPLSRGCHALIRQGAKLVESGQDIAEEMGRPSMQATPYASRPNQETIPDDGLQPDSSTEGPASGEAMPGLDAAQYAPLLKALGYDPVDIDTLQNRCGLPTGELHAVLTQCELAGLATRLADGRWQRNA